VSPKAFCRNLVDVEVDAIAVNPSRIYTAVEPSSSSEKLEFAQMGKAKLTMPVLSIAGEKACAAILGPQMKLVVGTVTAVDMKRTGHWLMDERPEETMEALIAFL
jgi:pimeloyl-ACP methyl ester carboxylesterase